MSDANLNASPPRWRWMLRVLAGVVVLLGVNVVAYALLVRSIDRAYADVAERWREPPDLPHPDDKGLATYTVVGEDNAAYWYTRAIGSLAPTRAALPWDAWLLDQEGVFPLQPHYLAAARAFIEADAEAMSYAREARRDSHVDWGISPGDYTMLLPLLNDIRTVATRLSYRLALDHHDADAAEWLATILDTQHLAYASSTYGYSLVVGLTSNGIDALAVSNIMLGVQHTPPGLTREAWLAELAGERAAVLDLVGRLLDDERHWTRLETAWRGKAVAQWLTGQSPDAMAALGVSELPNSHLVSLRPLGRAGVLLMTRYTDRQMHPLPDNAQAAAQQKYGTRPSSLASVPLWWMPQLLMPSYERAHLAFFRVLAERRVAAVVLAVVLFEADHGRLPGTLNDLVPAYLPAVPVDPFAPDGGVMRWSAGGGGVVWSVGEDGVDDGGDRTSTVRIKEPPIPWERRDAVFSLQPPERLQRDEDDAEVEDGPPRQEADHDEQQGPRDE